MGIQLKPFEIDGEVGLDVTITDEMATVADLLGAMQHPADDPRVYKPYHRQRYAACAGCSNNCCKYNCITIDLIAAKRMAEHHGMDLARFAKAYLQVSEDLPYPEFKRQPCPFLKENLCTVYQGRALICRLYLCTPMSDRLEKLRAAVSFAGEAALRERLFELGWAPKSWSGEYIRESARARYRRREISKMEWQRVSEDLNILTINNPFFTAESYKEILLRDCCPEELWAELRVSR